MAQSYVVNTRWFRIYWKGSYSWFEIEFGPKGKDLVFYLLNTNSLIKFVNYRKLMKELYKHQEERRT